MTKPIRGVMDTNVLVAAFRSRRVDWSKVDEILGRVPDVAPLPGDER